MGHKDLFILDLKDFSWGHRGGGTGVTWAPYKNKGGGG